MGRCQASLKGKGTWLRPSGPGMEGRAHPAASKAVGPYLPWRRDHHGTQHFLHPIALLAGAPCQLDLMGTCHRGHMAWWSPLVPMPIVPAQNTWLAQDAQLQHARCDGGLGPAVLYNCHGWSWLFVHSMWVQPRPQPGAHALQTAFAWQCGDPALLSHCLPLALRSSSAPCCPPL